MMCANGASLPTECMLGLSLAYHASTVPLPIYFCSLYEVCMYVGMCKQYSHIST